MKFILYLKKKFKVIYCLFWAAIPLIVILVQYFTDLIFIREIKIEKTGVQLWLLGFDSNGRALFDYEGYSINFFSFFTIQTNIFVIIWFLCAPFFESSWKRPKILRRDFTIIIASMISITFFIFWLFLFPINLPLSPIIWINSIILHFCSPVAMLLYLFIWYDPRLVRTTKKFLAADLWKIYIYPFIYLAYSLIRGEFLFLANKHPSIQYPYFFLNIHSPQPLKEIAISGVGWLFIVGSIIFIILSSTAILYNYLLNLRVINCKKSKLKAIA
ncbi:hypothetical protein SSABA_v1c02400 [Spiroplasma sabaudiense Ar-1343]|uniref:Transmembrane protein n=1 Tax=Spiroplasma sabaudiense Ar-1343 TaxID=1276257 RepID=W6A9E8_9MOLU|nr:Pr6Pr family membrane protein [Spiroplasma sabaudiense]AHI53652.1 hypothetical protein SSABA_v1c02400 [Spiroplasma sabaudiense Ar-1343]